MKKFLFFFLLASNAVLAGYFNYVIEIQESDAIITTTIGLDSSTLTNSFRLKGFYLPENSEVISLRDTLGEIKNYVVEDNTLSFETNKGSAKNKETVELKFKVKGFRQGGFSPLYYSDVSLAAHSDSDLTVEVKGERIISFEAIAGFNGEVRNGTLKIVGTGPIAFFVFYSPNGKEFEHYILFNKSTLSDKELEEKGLREADKLFELIPQIIGLKPPFEKIPLIVLTPEEYGEKINTYSEGVYRTGGLLVINEKSFEKNACAVILHETTHAFNAQALKWNESDTAWFDEGMAKFVEGIVRKLRGERTSNLFYGNITWREGAYKYTLRPRGEFSDLAEYLEQRKQFMLEWDAGNAKTREFGYAFSELYIKELIKEKGFSLLQNAYRKMLEITDTTKDGTEFSNRLIGLLEKELYPCDRKTEQEIKECVKELNALTPKIPEKTSVLQLGLVENEKEFESIGKMHELNKKILLEKIESFREKMLGLVNAVFSKISERRQRILAGVKS